MKIGHILALVGGLFALLGVAALDWQTFEIAQVTVTGAEVAPTGQLLLLLCLLVVVGTLAGLVTRARYRAAALVCAATVLGLALMAWANMGRLEGYTTMAYEQAHLGLGFTFALVGLGAAFVGSLVVFASEPTMKADGRYLRVALLWHGVVIEEEVLSSARTFRVGEGLRSDFIVPEEKLPAAFPLFRADRRGRYEVALTETLAGHMTLTEHTGSVADHLARLRRDGEDADVCFVSIDEGDWGTVRMEHGLSVFFQFVQPDGAAPSRRAVAFEEGMSGALGMAAFILCGAVVLAVLGWDDFAERHVDAEAKYLPDVIGVPVAVTEPEPPPEVVDDDADDMDVAKRAGGPEGEFGDPDTDEERTELPPLDAKMVDAVDPARVGLTDLLSRNTLGSGPVAELLNQNSEGLANSIAVAMSGDGDTLLVGRGAGGLGFTGGETGGGDKGLGRIRGMGTIDTGPGPGVRVGLTRRPKRQIGTVEIGRGTETGFCRKQNISSVVRRRAGAIRACYEQRLQVAKGIKGKLTAQWTIKSDGTVGSATLRTNTLRDSSTSNCVLRAVRRMRFEKPTGGICIVQWPFVFAPG
ncbi:MAG: hypothetical protein ACI9MR_001255 [Myxococcota bacterium]|jgi:hypothetical protein